MSKISTARSETRRSPQYAQIVVAGVKNQRLYRQGCEKSTQLQSRQGIDQVMLAIDRELDQTDFFEVVVQTVGFGIHGDSRGGVDALAEFVQ